MSLIDTNPYLKDKEMREKLIKRSVRTSCGVEGIKKMMEVCALCGHEGTPWQKVDGHVCINCAYDAREAKWTPIEESYPANNEEVIIYMRKDDRAWVTTGMFSVDPVVTSKYKRSPVWLIHGNPLLDKYIVGWMSLPEPPK